MFIRFLDSYTQTQSPPSPRLSKHSLGKWFSAKWAETPDDHIFKEFKIERGLFFIYKIGENATTFQFQINLFSYWTEQAKNTISLFHRTD